MKKKWLSRIPKQCDICKGGISDSFVDGKVGAGGGWAIMCLSCHADWGNDLGIGRGQIYQKQGEEFIKIGG